MIDTAAIFDDAATPDARLRAIGNGLMNALNAGEFEQLPEDTLRFLLMVPTLILEIAGDVFEMRRPVGRVARLAPVLAVIEGGRP